MSTSPLYFGLFHLKTTAVHRAEADASPAAVRRAEADACPAVVRRGKATVPREYFDIHPIKSFVPRGYQI